MLTQLPQSVKSHLKASLLCIQRAVHKLCRWFCQWLEESSTDFRVGAQALKDTSFAVFGCGNSLYESKFNKARV